MKYIVISSLILLSACAQNPGDPEQISPPAVPAAEDHSRLQELSLSQLLAEYREDLVHASHAMNERAGRDFVESTFKETQSRFSNIEDSLRHYLIGQLSLKGRNIPMELSPPFDPTPDDFAVVQTIQCTVDFADPNALTNTFAQARSTFAVWSEGSDEQCNSATGNGCWIYKQACGLMGDIRYEEYPFGAQGHFHLSFQNEELDCYGANGGFGRMQDGECNTDGINYAQEDRYANGHLKNHYQRLWVQDNGEAVLFSADRVRVIGAEDRPAYVSFQKEDGSWWAWRNLAPGYYDIGDWVNGVIEMRFKGGDESTGVTGIDDIRVSRTIISEL